VRAEDSSGAATSDSKEQRLLDAGAIPPSAVAANGCLRNISNALAPEAWFDAAANACQPGSLRLGVEQTQQVDRTDQATFELPERPSSSCFSIYTIVSPNLLPIEVAILDDKGHAQELGTLQTERAATPELGALCTLDAQVKTLRLRVARAKSGTIRLAVYGAK